MGGVCMDLCQAARVSFLRFVLVRRECGAWCAGRRRGVGLPAATFRTDLPEGWPVRISGPPTPPDPAATPRIMNTTVIPGRATEESPAGDDQ